MSARTELQQLFLLIDQRSMTVLAAVARFISRNPFTCVVAALYAYCVVVMLVAIVIVPTAKFIVEHVRAYRRWRRECASK